MPSSRDPGGSLVSVTRCITPWSLHLLPPHHGEIPELWRPRPAHAQTPSAQCPPGHWSRSRCPKRSQLWAGAETWPRLVPVQLRSVFTTLESSQCGRGQSTDKFHCVKPAHLIPGSVPRCAKSAISLRGQLGSGCQQRDAPMTLPAAWRVRPWPAQQPRDGPGRIGPWKPVQTRAPGLVAERDSKHRRPRIGSPSVHSWLCWLLCAFLGLSFHIAFICKPG